MKNMKDYIDKDVSELLKDYINTHLPKRKMQMYTGKVEDNQDPDQIGRCRIRVFGVFNDANIKTEDLPWAKPEHSFVGSTIGSFIVPPVDTLVRVYFDNDDVYNPVYTTKVVNTSQLPSDISEDYPDTMVFFETDAGDYFQINRSSLEMQFRHSSGFYVTVNSDGNVTIKNTESDEGKLDINVVGDVSLSTDGDVSVEANKGNIKLGGNSATQPCNNLPACLFTGAPHSTGRQFPGQKGSTLVRP